MLALLLGMLAGATHVVAGPDHLAAVAPLSLRRGGWRSGFLWGVGHTSGVWVAGCGVLLFQRLFPVALMASWSDRLAGGALVLVGLWTLVGSGAGWLRLRRLPHLHQHVELKAASVFGILHGLGGSSHYFGVLPAFAFGSAAASAAYLFGFGLATVAAMSACAWGLGRASVLTRVAPVLRGSCGAAAVVVGILWAVLP